MQLILATEPSPKVNDNDLKMMKSEVAINSFDLLPHVVCKSAMSALKIPTLFNFVLP